MQNSVRLKRRDSVHTQGLPDGSALLFDTVAAIAYPITESAARIWNLCDGEHTLAQIVDEIEAHYDVSRETVSADTQELMKDLLAKELADEVAAEPT